MTKGHAVTRYGFRLPPDQAAAMTDEAVADLVGKVGTLDLFGVGLDRPVRVVSASRVTDEMLGPGVWVEAVGWDPPADPPPSRGIVQAARLHKLDADGQPVGEWINLEGEWQWP